MAIFEIKHRVTGSILFSLETESLKFCVEAAVKSSSDLGGAYLGGAYLGGADLGGAYLGGADLRGAYLGGADLSDAHLSRADLGGAHLSRADLSCAGLSGAKLHNGIVITRAPVFIGNLHWPVLIFDAHMKIGCEFHTHQEWMDFSEEEWARMGGKEAIRMKREFAPALFLICDAHAAEVEK